jgi:hypothetical protein
MKYILFIILLATQVTAGAQKYALLDKRFAQPITYTNVVSTADKLNGLFPVEKSTLKQFVKTLEEISAALTSKEPLKSLKQYEFGCTKFTGVMVPLARGDRVDYVITSTCTNQHISMHLSDAKLNNASNAYYVNTWISYIKSYLK